MSRSVDDDSGESRYIRAKWDVELEDMIGGNADLMDFPPFICR